LVVVAVLISFMLMLLSSYSDNLRGVILPLITKELDLSYSYSSWMLSLGHGAAASVAIGLMVFLKKHSLRSALWMNLVLMSLVILGGQFVNDFGGLLLFAFTLGGVITAFGTIGNLLIMQVVSSAVVDRMLAALHVMYGLGSMMAPVSAGFFLEYGHHWSFLFSVVLIGVVAVGLGLAFQPLIGRDSSPSKKDDVCPSRHFETPALKSKLWRLEVLLQASFICYVTAEVGCAMWMTTYLVESEGLTLSHASVFVAMFFLCLTITRVLTFVFVKPYLNAWVLLGCLIVGGCCFVAGLSGEYWALPLVGVVGPYFPLLMARLSRTFFAQRNRVTLTVILLMQVALLGGHWFLGKAVTRWGASYAYWWPAVMLAMTIIFVIWYLFKEKNFNNLRSQLYSVSQS
jgi:fucose permease